MATRTNTGTNANFLTDIGGAILAGDLVYVTTGRVSYNAGTNLAVALNRMVFGGTFQGEFESALQFSCNSGGSPVIEINSAGRALPINLNAGTATLIEMRAAGTTLSLAGGTVTTHDNWAGKTIFNDDCDVDAIRQGGGEVFVRDSTSKTIANNVEVVGGQCTIQRPVVGNVKASNGATVWIMRDQTAVTVGGNLEAKGAYLGYSAGTITGTVDILPGATFDLSMLKGDLTITGQVTYWEGSSVKLPPTGTTITYTTGGAPAIVGRGPKYIPYGG